jgi:hypothetical protein
MNLIVNDLTLTGKIIFPDGSYLESSYASLFRNFLNLERNSITGTTTLLSDRFIVSNQIASPSLLSSIVSLEGVTFQNDLDDEGIAVLQTRGFSELIRTKILETQAKVDSVVPDMIDGINREIHLVNADESYSHHLYPYESSVSRTGGPTSTMNAGDLTTYDNEEINVSQLTCDYLSITNNSTNLSSNLTANSLNIASTAGDDLHLSFEELNFSQNSSEFKSNLNKERMLLEALGKSTELSGNGCLIENINGKKHQLSADDLKFQHNGLETSLSMRKLEVSPGICYEFDSSYNFFRLNNPFSLKTYYLSSGDEIRKYYGVVGCEQDNSTLLMLNYTEYLDDQQQAGWSCLVTNFTGGDLQVDCSPHFWYAHNQGFQNNSIIVVKKWATVRLIMMNYPINGYVWAVQQF